MPLQWLTICSHAPVSGAELTVSMGTAVERERDLLEELGENVKEMVVPPTSVPGKPVIGEVVDEKVAEVLKKSIIPQ
jgi:hypothetical protein